MQIQHHDHNETRRIRTFDQLLGYIIIVCTGSREMFSIMNTYKKKGLNEQAGSRIGLV